MHAGGPVRCASRCGLLRSALTPPDATEGASSAPDGVQGAEHAVQPPSIPQLALFGADGKPAAASWALMRDIAAGLAALHAAGVCHRDLKPRNVLVTAGGRAKLSDMGLSRALPPDQSSFEPTAAGGGAGTSGWLAPERLAGEARQGRGVDTWALGCLLFYCLTGGAHPFGDRLARDAAIAARAPPALHRLASMPEAQALLVRSMRR